MGRSVTTFTTLGFPKPEGTDPISLGYDAIGDLADAVDAQFRAPIPACRVYHGANQSIANNLFTALTFNSERYDTAAMHSTSVNPTRITIPAAGIYSIGGNVSFQAHATGYRGLGIRLNGTAYLASVLVPAVLGGVVGTEIDIAGNYVLAANDYIELMVGHTAGVALNVMLAPNYSPEFWATRLGAAV